MDTKSLVLFSVVTLLVIQQTPVCEASWLQDLMARFGNFGQAKNAHVAVYGDDGSNAQPVPVAQQPQPTEKNKGSWTHELIAAAAGFEAMRVYERRQAKQKGAPPSHSVVKGILAGLAAAAVDRLIETKGLDWIDAQKAKRGATKTAEDMVDQVERGGGSVATNNAGSSSGNRGRNNGADGETFNQQLPPAANDEY
ncbi:hypothetical protein BV898_16027 [Hypsibius exemplaris]|uniref:Uncharacterized protein n=1 Tax=Hypsibius exemplaris TaxID=2072580 RepID=A0A9X6NF34_HYPEX|nr:hypothetical protein BV898_16027 [Hypsibius exemplaris]